MHYALFKQLGNYVNFVSKKKEKEGNYVNFSLINFLKKIYINFFLDFYSFFLPNTTKILF